MTIDHPSCLDESLKIYSEAAAYFRGYCDKHMPHCSKRQTTPLSPLILVQMDTVAQNHLRLIRPLGIVSMGTPFTHDALQEIAHRFVSVKAFCLEADDAAIQLRQFAASFGKVIVCEDISIASIDTIDLLTCELDFYCRLLTSSRAEGKRAENLTSALVDSAQEKNSTGLAAPLSQADALMVRSECRLIAMLQQVMQHVLNGDKGCDSESRIELKYPNLLGTSVLDGAQILKMLKQLGVQTDLSLDVTKAVHGTPSKGLLSGSHDVYEVSRKTVDTWLAMLKLRWIYARMMLGDDVELEAELIDAYLGCIETGGHVGESASTFYQVISTAKLWFARCEGQAVSEVQPLLAGAVVPVFEPCRIGRLAYQKLRHQFQCMPYWAALPYLTSVAQFDQSSVSWAEFT